jgi:hypothetical protein
MAKARKKSLQTQIPKQSADIVAPHVAVKGSPGVYVRLVDGAHIIPESLDVEVPVNENRISDGVVVVRSAARRVKAPIDLAKSYGRITDEQHAAATRLYECFAFGVCGASQGPKPGHTPAKPVGGNGITDGRVQAMTHFRRALLSIVDKPVRHVVAMVVCHENTVIATAADMGLSSAVTMTYLRTGLDSVAEYFEC